MQSPGRSLRPPRGDTMMARVAGWIAAGALLAAVFMAYLKPDMTFQLANQLWSCF